MIKFLEKFVNKMDSQTENLEIEMEKKDKKRSDKHVDVDNSVRYHLKRAFELAVFKTNDKVTETYKAIRRKLAERDVAKGEKAKLVLEKL